MQSVTKRWSKRLTTPIPHPPPSTKAVYIEVYTPYNSCLIYFSAFVVILSHGSLWNLAALSYGQPVEYGVSSHIKSMFFMRYWKWEYLIKYTLVLRFVSLSSASSRFKWCIYPYSFIHIFHGSLYYCPGASEVTLKERGKSRHTIKLQQNTT